MDSLTQIVLGAAVGEATLGKKVGNRAALWGAIAGTIPDLDVFMNFFQGELQSLITHRGVTHSIVFSILMAPVLGWLISWIYKGKRGSPRDWTKLAFWALFTHPLLDCFTTWGTQLFYPFTDYRVAFNTIFVVDPVYTLPFMLCLIVALFLSRESRARRIWTWVGITISSFYLLITVTNKLVVDAVFTNALHTQGKSVYQFSTYPSPLNNLLWYVVAEEPSGFDIGYYSLLGDQDNIDFSYIPKNHKLIDNDSTTQDNYVIDRLKWVSKGQFALEQSGDTLLWHDLRFGVQNLFMKDFSPVKPSFTFKVYKENGEYVEISQGRPDTENFNSEAFQLFWDRIMGK